MPLRSSIDRRNSIERRQALISPIPESVPRSGIRGNVRRAGLDAIPSTET
jgi:hypothetical protein